MFVFLFNIHAAKDCAFNTLSISIVHFIVVKRLVIIFFYLHWLQFNVSTMEMNNLFFILVFAIIRVSCEWRWFIFFYLRCFPYVYISCMCELQIYCVIKIKMYFECFEFYSKLIFCLLACILSGTKSSLNENAHLFG